MKRSVVTTAYRYLIKHCDTVGEVDMVHDLLREPLILAWAEGNGEMEVYVLNDGKSVLMNDDGTLREIKVCDDIVVRLPDRLLETIPWLTAKYGEQAHIFCKIGEIEYWYQHGNEAQVALAYPLEEG